MFPFHHLAYKDWSQSFLPLAGKLLESRGHRPSGPCCSLELGTQGSWELQARTYSTYKHTLQRAAPCIQILVLRFAGLSEGGKVTHTLKFKAVVTSLMTKKGDTSADFSGLQWRLDDLSGKSGVH